MPYHPFLCDREPMAFASAVFTPPTDAALRQWRDRYTPAQAGPATRSAAEPSAEVTSFLKGL